MKRIILFFIYSVILCSFSPSLLQGGTNVLQEMARERSQTFSTVVKDTRLLGDLVANAYVMDQNFDYASLMDDSTDVLLIGETHSDGIPQHDVNLIIKNLVEGRSGLTHVGSEFLLSSEQPFLDKFARGEIGYTELKKNVELENRAFIAVICKRYKVNLVGLDLPRAQQDYAWAMSVDGMTQRNNAWLQIIKKIRAKKPHSKFLIYGGANHMQKYSHLIQTMPQLLANSGFKTKTIEFVNEKDPEWKNIPVDKSYDILFIIPEKLKKFVGADYVVYTNPKDASKEDMAANEKVIKKIKSSDDLAFDACVYDPENQVCRSFLKARRR